MHLPGIIASGLRRLQTGTGAATITEAGDTLLAFGVHQIFGSAAITEEGDTLLATNAPPITGTLTATEADDTITSAGIEIPPNLGSLELTEAGDTLVASGQPLFPIAGTATLFEAGDTLVASGQELTQIQGVLAVTEADDTLFATSQQNTNWGNIPGTNRGEDIVISASSATGNYMTIGVAVDLDAGQISAIVGKDTSYSTPQSISLVTGAKFPVFSAFNLDSAIVNFGASPFEHPVPGGYTAWDASATWNPSDKDSSITLSAGNLRASGTVASSWRSARGTVSKSTGKWYFEVTCRVVTAPNNGFIVGVANATQALNNYAGSSANSAGFQSTRAFLINGGFTNNVLTRTLDEYSNDWRTVRSDLGHATGHYYVEILCNAVSTGTDPGSGLIGGIMRAGGPLRSYLGSDAGGASAGFQSSITRAFIKSNVVTTSVLPNTWAAATILGLDIDLDAKTIRGRVDNGSWSAARDITSVVSGDVFLAVSVFDGPSIFDSITCNFGQTAFVYTPPAGASDWDQRGDAILREDASYILREDESRILRE